MIQPMLALAADAGCDPILSSRLFDVSRLLSEHVQRGEPIDRATLSRLMEEAFGGSDADGAWSMRNAYDALETAQVLLLSQRNSNGQWPASL